MVRGGELRRHVTWVYGKRRETVERGFGFMVTGKTGS